MADLLFSILLLSARMCLLDPLPRMIVLFYSELCIIDFDIFDPDGSLSRVPRVVKEADFADFLNLSLSVSFFPPLFPCLKRVLRQ